MEDFYRSQFRLPQSLYEKLKAATEQNGRPLNTELVKRLEASFAGPDARVQAPSAELLEQVIDYQRLIAALLFTLEEAIRMLEDDKPNNISMFTREAEEMMRDVRSLMRTTGRRR